MPTSTLVTISPSYVRRSLALGVIAGAIVPAGLILFMARFGFNAYLAIGLVVGFAVLAWTSARTYRRALTQAIQLFPDRIVFDYITYRQEYSFSTATEWKLEDAGNNWRLTALTDGSTKAIPISAFPDLGNKVRSFYCGQA